VKPNLEQS